MVALAYPRARRPPPSSPPARSRPCGGAIVANFRDDYAFSADGRGKFSLTVNGTVVLETGGEDVSTVAGKACNCRRARTPSSPATRAPPPATPGCACSGRRPRPSSASPSRGWLGPASACTTRRSKALHQAGKLRQGELLATLRCVKCHVQGSPPAAGAGDMPELAMDAPSLKDAGTRLNAAWIAKWILDPPLCGPTPPCRPASPAPTPTRKLST